MREVIPVCTLHDCDMEPDVRKEWDEQDRPLYITTWRCPEGASLAQENCYETPTGFPPGCAAIQK